MPNERAATGAAGTIDASEPRITRLANGLRVVSQDMPGFESTSVGVWVDAGARHEPEAVNGISHMLEHMLFKGTERRDARAIAEEIEAVGGHLNAYTTREQTAFTAKVLKGDVALAVDLIADILQNSVFDGDELKRERAVVIQEIGQAFDTPDDIVFDEFQEVAFPGQPIGRPVLGTTKHVSGFTREALDGYCREHYTAERMVLSAAGRIDHDLFVAMAEERFGGLKPGTPATFEPARYSGGDYRSDRPLEQVHIVLGFPGIAYDDDDYYALQVLSTVLGGGMSSRLFQEVREKRGLAYSIFSFGSSFVDGGIFGIYAGTGADAPRELLSVVGGEFAGIATRVEAGEANRARTQLKSGLLMSLESSSTRCEQFARQLLIHGRVLTVDEIVKKVDAVDETQVAKLAERILSAGTPTLAALGPIAQVPAFDRIGGLLAGQA